MEYLIKASAILILFYICYKLFLNRETFFESNRTFLLVGIASAFLLPLVTIPKYIIQETQTYEGAIAFGNSISEPVTLNNSIGLFTILSYIYIIGIVFFLSRFLLQFGSLTQLYLKSTKKRVSSFIYVITKQTLSPFSFFKWIVFNPSLFKETELNQIIIHEKVHAKQYHSIDILFAEITCVFLWFNPLAWLYKNDLRQNLEFIADKNAQATTPCKKSYQHLLLKTSVPNYNLALTTNFYNSLIKKRIVMLQKNKSNKRNQLKFLFILPALTLFLMSFNTKEIYIEQEKGNTKISSAVLDLNDFKSSIDENTQINEPISNSTEKYINTQKVASNKQDIAIYFIESNFSDSDLDNLKDKLKDKGITLKIKGVKRNSANEIVAIKIDAKSKKSNANFALSNDSAIKTIRITYNAKDDSISIGNANGIIHEKDYKYTHEDGVITIDKLSGKGSNVFVYSSNDKHDGEHTIIADTIHYKGNVHIKDKNVFVIKDGSKVIELKGNTEKGGKTLYEWKSDDGNVIIHNNHQEKDGLFISKDGGKEVKIKISGNSLWKDDKDDKDDKDENIFIESIGKGKNKIFISSDENNNPLYIIDGKESTKKDMDKIISDEIESINIIKGDSAIKKYGDKGKEGVVEVVTKKNKD